MKVKGGGVSLGMKVGDSVGVDVNGGGVKVGEKVGMMVDETLGLIDGLVLGHCAIVCTIID